MSDLIWVINDKLARWNRPGWPGKLVTESEVEMWCNEVSGAGIKSILCLLDEEQLKFYSELSGGLLGYYKSRGFEVGHVPVKDHKWPPLDEAELARVWEVFRSLPSTVLVHCSAGIDRTGAAIEHLIPNVEAGTRSVAPASLDSPAGASRFPSCCEAPCEGFQDRPNSPRPTWDLDPNDLTPRNKRGQEMNPPNALPPAPIAVDPAYEIRDIQFWYKGCAFANLLAGASTITINITGLGVRVLTRSPKVRTLSPRRRSHCPATRT